MNNESINTGTSKQIATLIDSESNHGALLVHGTRIFAHFGGLIPYKELR